MAKKVTISDIAKKLSISNATVSKALTNATDINDLTREKVLSCASEMGYSVKQDRGSKLKNVVVFIYGVDLKNVDNSGYELTLGLQSAANKEGYGVIIQTINDEELKEGKYYDIMKKKKYVGSFFIGFKPHPVLIKHIEENNTPVVVLDNEISSQLVARVGCDTKIGMEQVVKHIYSLGHRKIAFLGGEEDSFVTLERQKYFEDSIKSFGLEVEGRLINYSSFSGEKLERPVLELLSQRPTAIICASDVIACNTIKIIKSKGLSVPDDISVTGYDDLPISRYLSPTLTTISQNRIQIGKSAFLLLKEMINGASISKLELRPELIIRDSTTAPKEQKNA